MLNVEFQTGRGTQKVFSSSVNLTYTELWNKLESKGFTKECFYILQNGRLINNGEMLVESSAMILPKFVGGKGGFGSMLRAIGAQIEKTTNREACRDLSGRRLRDINEEKRLKVWIEQQANRKEEAAERKKKKLERLCAVPKTEFQDKNYDNERSMMTEKIDSAVEEGFKIAKIVENSEANIKIENKKTKRKFVLDDFDDNINSDELSSSDDESTKEPEKKSLKTDIAIEIPLITKSGSVEKLSESSSN